MKGRIIAVINQKGGVGKSTTCDALFSGLQKRGFKVLGIDLDAQGNWSFTAGAEGSERTSLEVLQKRCTVSEAIQNTRRGDFIPSSGNMNDFTKTDEPFKEQRLREALKDIKADYDFVIIDTPPTLSFLTTNALTTSDSIIIPAEADAFSLQGVTNLSETIELIRTYSNPGLKVAGILLTKYNGRTVLGKELTEVVEDVARKMGSIVFQSKIREAVAIKEAQASQQGIFDYAPRSKVAQDYSGFIDELLAREGIKYEKVI